MYHLRPSYLGIIGGILAFISLVLPWWAVSISSSAMGNIFSDQATLYLYQAKVSILGISTGASNPWYASTALAFLVLSGLLGLTGSVIANGRRIVLALGGILALFSIIVFAAGLQNDISNGAVGGYPTGASLFSSGSYSLLGMPISYSAYLSFGFWLALVAAILMFAALKRKPAEAIPPPQPSPPLPS